MQSRPFSPLFSSYQGARLEPTLLPVERLGQGGELELSLLIQILAVTQFLFPSEPACPFPDSFTQGKFPGEMNTAGHDALSWARLWPERWAPSQRKRRLFNLAKGRDSFTVYKLLYCLRYLQKNPTPQQS